MVKPGTTRTPFHGRPSMVGVDLREASSCARLHDVAAANTKLEFYQRYLRDGMLSDWKKEIYSRTDRQEPVRTLNSTMSEYCEVLKVNSYVMHNQLSSYQFLHQEISTLTDSTREVDICQK